MKRSYMFGLLLGLTLSGTTYAATYDTEFDLPDQELTSNFLSGGPSVVNPAKILLVDRHFGPTDWTCEIRAGNLVLADPTESAQGDNGLCGVQATTLPPVFKGGAKAEVTIDKATIESIRDGALPEGLFAGLCLWDHAMGALTYFGVVRRPEGQDGYDWWHDHGGLDIGALSTRHSGYYVALSVSRNPSLTLVHGVETIEDAIANDVTFLASVDDKGKLSFAVNGAPFASPVAVPQPGGAALSVFNAGGSVPILPWSDVTFKRLRVSGPEVPEGPVSPNTAKKTEASESEPTEKVRSK